MFIRSLSFICVGLYGFSAMAAETADDSSGSLEEIVVTAEKRTEDLQKTSLAITAVSPEVLAERGVSNVQDLQVVVPGLQVVGSGNFYIRGVGTDATGESATLAVGYGVDGVFLSRAVNSSSLIYDVDHVEVLRGPQGSTNGANSSGGSINVVTKKPTQEFSGDAALEVGNYGTLKTQGVLNLPLSSEWAARLSFGTAEHNGYVNTGPTTNMGTQDDKAARLRLLYTPSDSISWLFGASYYKATGTGNFARPICASTSTTTLAGCPTDGYGFGNYGDARHYSLPGEYYTSNLNQNWGLTSDFEWDLGPAKLTYIVAFNDDTTQSISQTISVDSSGTAPDSYLPAHNYSDEWQLSHELRLAGTTGPVEWLGGVYYQNEHNRMNQNPEIADGVYLLYVGEQAGSEKAAFGQATWSVTDQLRLIGGGRYNVTTKYEDSMLGVGGTNPPTLAQNSTAPFNQHFTTFRAGLEYDVAPQSMLYATVSDGYKPGAYNAASVPESLRIFKPEKLVDYEVGSKNRFLGDTLQVNGDVFYYDYSNLQVTYDFGPGVGGTVNAAKARSYGAELSTVYLPTENDRVSFDANYLHANYTSFKITAYASDGNGGYDSQLVDYTGNPLAHSPDWIFNLGYEHKFTLSNGARLTPRADVHYESDQNMSFQGFAITHQDAFARLDTSLAYAPNDRWQAQLYVRNVTNQVYLTSATVRGFTPSSETTAVFSDPRTFGVRLEGHF